MLFRTQIIFCSSELRLHFRIAEVGSLLSLNRAWRAQVTHSFNTRGESLSGPAAFDGFWLAKMRRTSSSVVIKFQLLSFCEDSDILRFSTSAEKSYLSKRLKNRLRSSAYSAVVFGN